MDKTGPEPTLLLHHEDTWLLEFEATITGVRSEAGGSAVALDRTAFYAESGGQPADEGTLAGRPLLGLTREDQVVWHRIGEGDWAVGETVIGSVDAARRREHMQQHTGQHILSQAFVREGGRNTRGFHLGSDESTIDLDGDRPDDPLVDAVTAAANDCVLANRPVRIHQVPRAELDRYPLRRDPGVPGEVLRLIEIEDWDWSACGGTHARRTGEVGPIQVLGVEKIRSLWRVRFLAGGRTLRYLARAHRVLDETARTHSLRWDAIAAAARDWTAEIALLTREVRRLRLERGEREGERLLQATAPGPQGVRLLGLWRDDASLDEIRSLATRFASGAPAVILAGCPDGERETWLAACSAVWPVEAGASPQAGDLLREWLATRGGRGGGSASFAQGGAPRRPAAIPGAEAQAYLQKRIVNGLGASE